ncbi:MAG: protein phosphatase 2C domain-containing protein [Myxococcota bacterium]
MQIRYFGHTDVGLAREHNEDSHLADPDLGVFVVADGVGGRAKGEVASQETVELIWEWLKRNEATIKEIAAGDATARVGQLTQIVRGAIQNACYMIHSMGELDPEQRGMSTTASLFLVCGNVGVVGQVGDSRVYLVREGEVAQLTEDHTLINYQLKHGLITPEQAQTSRAKNVITRAVGHKDYVEVDTLPIPLFDKDRIILCSDGFHGYAERPGDMEFFRDMDVEDAVLEAVRFANDCGGKDNITVLAVELHGDAQP